ncbi:Protein chromatin remodeling 20 [Vitis vinifera]|uniref:Protein chromatin remodeling 20 n=1 Tax=Vitis vinifera TaxID=29760 RepID=A0A438D688_VITVI|nr:Protein chromatin remodeling 20 [Vitis vinifera]
MKEPVTKDGPDILVCDEAHMIKNTRADTTQALKQVKCQRRIALTGSPLQNNLMEYYCMVDFVREGFLGSSHEFRNRFQNPIENGQHMNSTSDDVKIMNQRSHILYEQLKGFVQRMDMSVVKNDLPPKTVFVMAIWNHPGILQLTKEEKDYARREDGVENFLADDSSSDDNIDYNTVLGGFFQSSKGLKLGTLLSPYLFVVAMEAQSLSRSNGSFMLVAHVVWSLFGLKVNLEKSKLIPLGSVDQVEELILVPGFKVGTLPFTYLGCLWELLLDLWQYVMGWKRSFVKRLLLWKYSSSLKGKVKLRSEKIQWDFLWEGGGLVKNIHLVKWSAVCFEKNKANVERKRVGGGLVKLDMAMELDFGIHYEGTKHFLGNRYVFMLLAEKVRNKNEIQQGKVDSGLYQKGWWNDLLHENNYKEVDYSGKMVLLLDILTMCADVGDKALVFSQSLSTLDLIEYYLSKLSRQGKKGKCWKQGKDWYSKADPD